jgi:hypothetical protein
MKIGVGCASLVAVCGVCTLGAAATQGRNDTLPLPANTAAPTTPAPTAPKATPTPTHAKAWHTVQSFSGTGGTQTDTIHIPDGAHLVWSYTAANGYAVFDITLYDASNDFPIDVIQASHANGTYTVHGGGAWYLRIGAANLNSWQVQIQVYE